MPDTLKDSNELIPSFIRNDGQMIMPSFYLTRQQEAIDAQMDFLQEPGETKRNAVSRVRNYIHYDEMRKIFTSMPMRRFELIRYIGNFKSVQAIQMDRLVKIFPDIFTSNNVRKDLLALYLQGLVQLWKFRETREDDIPEIKQKWHYTYTLTGFGFQFLKMFDTYTAQAVTKQDILKPQNSYFNPDLFDKFPSNIHIKFWQSVDLHMLFVCSEKYIDSTFSFVGDADVKCPRSPLQVSVQDFNLSPNQTFDKANLIVYNALMSDWREDLSDDNSKMANQFVSLINPLVFWSRFTKKGAEITKSITSLPDAKANILCFYFSTYEEAKNFALAMDLAEFRFPIMLIVGEKICNRNHGLTDNPKGIGFDYSFYIKEKDKEDLTMVKQNLFGGESE